MTVVACVNVIQVHSARLAGCNGDPMPVAVFRTHVGQRDIRGIQDNVILPKRGACH